MDQWNMMRATHDDKLRLCQAVAAAAVYMDVTAVAVAWLHSAGNYTIKHDGQSSAIPEIAEDPCSLLRLIEYRLLDQS